METNEASQVGDSETVCIAQVRTAALRYLARREYATLELRGKLVRRFPDDLVDSALEELKTDGLLSDRRYAEALVRNRMNRGYGPRYIASELAQKGIDASLADEFLDVDPGVWLEKAHQLVAKRRLRPLDTDLGGANREREDDAEDRLARGLERSSGRDKLARLLGRRGFPSDVIYKVVH
jgi:SOS response regulatory protein OraA/RecX